MPYQDNGFSFEFAALSYRDPDRIRYRYRLDGLENEWTEVDSRQRYARYTDLWPGKYTFYVSASDGGMNWSGKAATLGIVIAPPWWMTRWSEFGAVAILASLIFGAHRWRVRALEEREEHLKILVDQRTAELHAANQAKSVFLANMSHELRTPLNAILGFTTLVRDAPNLAEEHRKDLDTVNRSGEHLLSLIDDVLDLSKIEAGRIVVANAPFDVNRLVSDIAEMMSARARAKNLALTVNTSSSVPAFARSDAAKVRQVLINLLGNAVKFTSQGSVTLKVDARPFEGERILLILEVQDTGVGIGPEDQARIFDAFVQAGQASTQKGTGLGLSITRQFVEMMGGTIEVQSTLGEGSLFRVELPVEQSSKPEIEETRLKDKYVVGLAPGQPEYRILIVEDQKRELDAAATALEGRRIPRAGGGGWSSGSRDISNLAAAPDLDGYKPSGHERNGGGSANPDAGGRRSGQDCGVERFRVRPPAGRSSGRRTGRFFGKTIPPGRDLRVHGPATRRALPLQGDRGDDPDRSDRRSKPQDLARLPRYLRDELAHALVRLDAGPIYEVIGRISAQDAPAGRFARELREAICLYRNAQCDRGMRQPFASRSQ